MNEITSSPEKEIFDPEKELQRIRKASKEDRPEELAEFKENLIEQKENIAETQNELTKVILENPDISFNEFHDKAFDCMRKFGLTQFQYSVALEVFQEYRLKREKILEMRKKYPENDDLFKAIFGLKPQGEIDIDEGPMTFYLKCFSPIDFATIYRGTYKNNRLPNQSEMLSVASISGGLIMDLPIPKLNGAVIVENSFVAEHQRAIIRTHEEQHVVNNLFRETFKKEYSLKNFLDAKTSAEKKRELYKYLRYLRASRADHRAKDEILAYFKVGHPNNRIFNSLMQDEGEGGHYDYLGPVRKEAKENLNMRYAGSPIKKYLKMLGFNPGKTAEKELQKLINEGIYKIFSLEYPNILTSGLESITKLELAGYEKDKILAILQHEPLAKWKKVTDRLLEDKTKKQ